MRVALQLLVQAVNVFRQTQELGRCVKLRESDAYGELVICWEYASEVLRRSDAILARRRAACHGLGGILTAQPCNNAPAKTAALLAPPFKHDESLLAQLIEELALRFNVSSDGEAMEAIKDVAKTYAVRMLKKAENGTTQQPVVRDDSPAPERAGSHDG